MADQPGDLMLLLRRIDAKLDRLGNDIRELKARVAAAGEHRAGVHRRIDRVGRRLDRADAPH